MPPRKVTTTTAAAYAHAPAASTAPSLYQQPTVPHTSSSSMTQTQPQGQAPVPAPAHATMPPVDDPVVQRIFNRLYARRRNIPHENVWTASENLAFLLRHKIGISLSENVERISIPIIHLLETHRRMAIVVVHPKDNNTLPPFPTSGAGTAATTAAGPAGANGVNASTPTSMSTFTATPSRMPPTPTPESPGTSMSPESPNANAAPTASMTAAQAQAIAAAAGATAMPANGPGATTPTLQRDGEAKLVIGVQCHEHHNIVETLIAEVDREIDMSLMSGVFKWA